MKSKSLGLFALSIFALLFLTSLTSAAVSYVSVSGATQSILQANSGTVSFQLNETGTGNFTISSFNVPLTLNFGSNTLVSETSVSGLSTTVLNQGTTSSTVSLTFDVPSNQVNGTYTGNLVLTGSYAGGPTTTFSLPLSITITSNNPPEIQNCNLVGNNGSLKINAIDFTNNGLPAANTTFGDDNKWFPFENINTKVDVKNQGSEDVNNIEVDWGIWDTQKDQWVIAPSELKNIDLSNGKTKTLYQSFTIDNNMDVDLSDLNNGNHYQFYIIANGDVNNAQSTSTCAYRAETATIAIESDFVAFTNLNVQTPVECGQTMQVTGELWNVGNNDQNSVSVDIIGSDSSLKLSQNVAVGDMNAFDNKPFSFSFLVPSSVDEKTYAIKFDVLDENGNNFQETLNDHYSEFIVPFAVSGGCTPQVSLIAGVTSGGQAGKPLVVKTTLTNTGTVAKTYTVSVADYSSWASSASVDQSTVILNPGASKDVSVTLNTNSDASGPQTFSVDLTSNTGLAITQPVSVTLTEAPGFLGLTGSSLSGTTWLWIIGILIVILIIAIIIVAVRVSRK